MRVLKMQEIEYVMAGNSCAEAIADFMEDGSLANLLLVAKLC